MLKLRRREVRVSSTMLWHAVLRDRQANTPWQKLRRNLLLLLQILILAGMVAALARPAVAIPAISSGSLVVVLDASASMNATDVQPSRFEAARAAVRSLVDGLSGNARMTLIQAGHQPQVLASAESDKLVLSSLLQQVKAENGSADWGTTLALAAGAASTEAGTEPATVVIVSDGGLPETGLPPLPGEVRYLPVGNSADNLAITALALRPAGKTLELFASLANYSGRSRRVVISLYRNGALIHAQAVDLADATTISLPGLPPGEAVYKAQLEPVSAAEEAPFDALPLDDSAFAVSQVEQNRRILVFTQGNFFLEQVLSALPGTAAYRALPAAAQEGSTGDHFQLPQETFDLYVLDGILPGSPQTSLPVLPQGNLLLINPPSTALFSVTGTFTATQPAHTLTHPLTQFVSWEGVHIAKAHYVQLPAWAQNLVSSGENPLVFAGETEGRRVAALTFDLHDSDLPLQVAYPILFANLVDYLAPMQAVEAQENMQAGETVNILPGAGITEVAVASPEGIIYSLPASEAGWNFTETQELGVYAVNFLKADSQSVERFAVNLFDPGESNIQPAAQIQLGQVKVNAASQEKLGKREYWLWLVLAAFGILLLEWWVFHRRP